MRRVVTATRSTAIALLPLFAFVHQTDTATAQGEAIFARAEKVAQNDAHARYANYDVVVSFDAGGPPRVDTWATTEDLTHAAVYADIFSQQEHRSPTTPHGSNLVFGLALQPATQDGVGASGDSQTETAVQSHPVNPQVTGDPIGPVAFAVDQNFGLTPPQTYAVVNNTADFSAHAQALTVIGRTGATETPRYRVTLAGTSGPLDHLVLTPLRDPYHNRLRELWVDDASGQVREAIVQGIGDRAPFDRARWDVTFVRKEGATYVETERALGPIDFGGGTVLHDITVTFDRLELTSAYPKALIGISTPVQALHDP
jgi:hypothetical protein